MATDNFPLNVLFVHENPPLFYICIINYYTFERTLCRKASIFCSEGLNLQIKCRGIIAVADCIHLSCT